MTACAIKVFSNTKCNAEEGDSISVIQVGPTTITFPVDGLKKKGTLRAIVYKQMKCSNEKGVYHCKELRLWCYTDYVQILTLPFGRKMLQLPKVCKGGEISPSHGLDL